MKSKKSNPRRNFIKKSVLAASAFSAPDMLFGANSRLSPRNIGNSGKGNPPAPKRIALIANIYRNSAHADVIATKIFAGIPTDEGMVDPEIKIVSVWIDQIGDNDTGIRIAKMNGAEVYST
ncbi:MAG: hypothetical protein WD431_17155, partial [Cyclobacteriaceae bacterium]